MGTTCKTKPIHFFVGVQVNTRVRMQKPYRVACKCFRGPLLRNTIVLIVAILCYAETCINTFVSGVTCSSDKPGTPVSLILPINPETSSQLWLHPTWLDHPLSWRVSLCNLLIRVTQSQTSIFCVNKGQARLGWRQILPLCLPALTFGLSS